MSDKDGDRLTGWKLMDEALQRLATDNYQGAAESFGQAVRQFKIIGDAHAESYALDLLAGTHLDLGNFDQANQFYREGLAAAQKVDKSYTLVVEHLDGLATSYSNMGQWRQAIEYFQQALAETEKPIVALRVKRGQILQHLANLYARYTTEFDRALSLYDEAIAISSDHDDQYNIATCLTFKGSALHALNQIEKALDLHERARDIAETKGYKVLLGMCYAHLAEDYFQLRRYALAKKYCALALEIDKTYGNKQGHERDLHMLARLHWAAGDTEAALQAYEEGLVIARSIKDARNIIHFLSSIAPIYISMNQAHRARPYLEEAITLSRKIGDQRSKIELKTMLAALNDGAEAFDTLEKELINARTIGFKDLEQDIETRLARLAGSRGDYIESLDRYRRSVSLLEQMRSSFRVEEHLRAFSETYADVYERLVDLSLKLGREVDALAYAERARARVLNIMRRARSTGPMKNAAEIDAYREARNHLLALDEQIYLLRREGKSVDQDLTDRLQKALLQETEFLLKAPRGGQEEWSEKTFDTVGLDRLQAQLSRLKEDVLVLAYYTTAEDGYLFLIGKDSFRVERLGASVTMIKSMVQDYRAALHVHELTARDLILDSYDESTYASYTSSPDEYLPPGRRLFDLLIRPVLSECVAAGHICIIPHGPLHFLPFHALHDGTRYLIEEVPISYAPSATALSESLVDEFSPIERVLALGDPASHLAPLPFARQEVMSIGKLLGAQRCLEAVGETATRDIIICSAASADGDPADEMSFDAWHFATHAVFVQSSPHLSYLQLTSSKDGDGRLFAYEIARMKKVARFCTLSACQTAMTPDARGDELNGLLFSFMAAGAQAVLATLWSVADRSIATLMESFYRNHLRSNRLSIAVALQQAQIEMLSAPETASPYHWAPVVLHGSWNPALDPSACQEAVTSLQTRTPAGIKMDAQVFFYEGNSYLSRVRARSETSALYISPSDNPELNNAAAAFSRALELRPDFSAAYRQRGIAHFELWKSDEGIADLRRALELDPDDSIASALLGYALASGGGDRQEALEFLERAFLLNPVVQITYPRINTYRLEAAMNKIRAEKRVAQCTQAIASSPVDANLYVERGQAYWHLSLTGNDFQADRERAAQDFKRALDLDSDNALAAVRLAWIEHSTDKSGAIEAYSAMARKHPDCAEARLRLANAYDFHQQPEEASAEYLMALRCDPKIEHAHCGLAKSYLELGRLRDAIEEFEKEREVSPGCFNTHLYLSEIYTALGRYDEAGNEYGEGIRTTSHSLYGGKLGIALVDNVIVWIKELARQEKDGAAKAQPIARMTGHELQAHLSLAHSLVTEGKVHEAIASYTGLIEKTPTYALAYAYRGACYSTLSDHDKGFADLFKAVELDSRCAVAHFNLYVLYRSRGESAKAQEHLDLALTLDPDLAERLGEKQAPKENASSPRGLEEILVEAYDASGLKCHWCSKKLRLPTGRLMVFSGIQIEDVLEGIPYYCTKCRITSCFKCSADPRSVKVLCRRCGSEITAWGQWRDEKATGVWQEEIRATRTGVCDVCKHLGGIVEAGLCGSCTYSSKIAVEYLQRRDRSRGSCDSCYGNIIPAPGEVFANDTLSSIVCRKCAVEGMEKYGKIV